MSDMHANRRLELWLDKTVNVAVGSEHAVVPLEFLSLFLCFPHHVQELFVLQQHVLGLLDDQLVVFT